ncbi:unnamed protein product, partial [marine sediment metagenome]
LAINAKRVSQIRSNLLWRRRLITAHRIITGGVPSVEEVRYPKVDTYADLPLASGYTGEIYVVLTATGVWGINRKRSGMWRSDGVNWNRLGVADADIVAIVQAGVKLNELQNPDGSIEFNQQEALQLAVEKLTSDPDTPVDGQIWLRTDL